MPVHKIILLPVLSIGLMVSAREAKAGIVDLGVVSGSIQVNGTITGVPSGFVETFSVYALVFGGPNLNLVINGQTVSEILSEDLGAQDNGTLGFNFPDLGLAGTSVANGNLLDPNNLSLVPLVPVQLKWTLTSFAGTPGFCPPNCVGTQTSNLSVLDPAGLVTAMSNAGILLPPPPGAFTDIAPLSESLTTTLNLGTMAGTTYYAEAANTNWQASANFIPASVPEPASWSLIALGAAAMARLRRRLWGRPGTTRAAGLGTA
jgi:hypothetical protein